MSANDNIVIYELIARIQSYRAFLIQCGSS